MTSDDLYKVARRAVVGSGWLEPADTAGDADDSWSNEAPMGDSGDEDPGLQLLAWVGARFPKAELRPLFIHGLEILYFRNEPEGWGAVILLGDEIKRLPLEPNDVRKVVEGAGLSGAARARVEDELNWRIAR